MAGHYHEELPLGVVPMLALGDPRLGDVHGELPAIPGFQQLREAAPIVHVHL